MSSNVAPEINGAVTKLNDHLAATVGDHVAKNGDGTTLITLAGENEGAAMKASEVEELVIVEAEDEEEEESILSAYTNSNYQAVNNSVLVSGSCAVKDPGVHVVVEHVDEIRDDDDDEAEEAAKRG